MLPLSQAPAGVEPATKFSLTTLPSLKFSNPNPFRRSKFIPRRNAAKPLIIALSKAEGAVDSTKQALSNSPSLPSSPSDQTVFVGDESVPLEGVIQFDKPDRSSRWRKWSHVALLAGGDVLALLLFSSIGRFSHGFPVFDFETLRTADPFIAGWFLSAYFLGGYGEDGRGLNGYSKAVFAASKSWALGIPLGLIIRAATSGHIPPYNFIGVTMGSTAVLLVGWRAIRYKVFPVDNGKKNDVYRRGNPFELFELLTSLVRRW
ncbi:uncharacterized protein LOC111798280 [Cucurbita pepo subsp. pepo]|uniref:uncharacterized protein LOC111784627 n=1 Tax=Cucurbita pepo subsp. pepo TaxID=3664 RepID=UPI000C9D6DD4|nr:uncharacterized protein LOC111784627 [Cucurbita pepo subsp. pepo]XP_023537100.1 uncharacterized protein LOC111798280 [Cucurbita pepo subsp. pepo]